MTKKQTTARITKIIRMTTPPQKIWDVRISTGSFQTDEVVCCGACGTSTIVAPEIKGKRNRKPNKNENPLSNPLIV